MIKPIILTLVLAGSALAQTPNFAITSGTYATSGTGVGLYTSNYYSSIYNNNVAGMFNGGFQPVQYGNMEYAIAGTSTIFASVNAFDPMPSNFADGWTYTVTCHNSATTCTGGASGSTGTISSNTAGVYGATGNVTSGSNVVTGVSSTAGLGPYASIVVSSSGGTQYTQYQTYVVSSTSNTITLSSTATGTATGAIISYGPTFTPSTAFSAAIANGDVMKIHSPVTPTTSASCSVLGWNVSGTGTCIIDTTDLPASPATGLPAPVQTVKITNTAGQTYQFQNYLDSTSGIQNYYFQGVYNGVIQAKLLSGSLQFCPILTRPITGGTYMTACTTISGTGWNTYSVASSNTNEGAATSTACGSSSPCSVAIGFQITGTGSAALFGFQMNRATHTTTGTWDDRVIAALQAGDWQELRLNILGSSGALPVLQSLQPEGYRPPSSASQISGNDPYGTSQIAVGIGLDDLMKNAAAMGANKVQIDIPPSASDADLTCLSDYLAGGSGTTCGAIRIALGTTTPWTSTMQKIIIAYDNEAWNSAQPGYWIGPGANGTNAIPMTVVVCQKLKGVASWNSSVMKCSANTQQALGGSNSGYITAADPSGYIDTQTSSVYHQVLATTCTQPYLDQSAYVEAWANVNDTSLTQYQIGNSAIPTTNYEAGNGTSTGSCTTSQIVGFPEGQGYGLMDVAVPAYLQRGFPNHYMDYNFWEFNGLNRSFSSTGSPPATTIAEWGAYPSSGGANFRARPSTYAQAGYNSVARLGTGRTITATNIPTYNFTASNGLPSENGVPYIDAFAFCGGSGSSCTSTARGIMVINFDTAASHSFTISGLDQPTGTVSKTLYTSTNVTDNNESSTVVTNSTSSQSGFTLDTLPPHSMAVYTWTVGSSSGAIHVWGGGVVIGGGTQN
jgi:hypothetical protein